MGTIPGDSDRAGQFFFNTTLTEFFLSSQIYSLSIVIVIESTKKNQVPTGTHNRSASQSDPSFRIIRQCQAIGANAASARIWHGLTVIDARSILSVVAMVLFPFVVGGRDDQFFMIENIVLDLIKVDSR